MIKSKAVIYCCTQSKDIDLQEKTVRDYCKWLGFEVIESYLDNGYCNYDDTRPSYNKLLEDLKSNKFDVIVTKGLFSLNASSLKLKKILKLLEEHNCNLIAMKENFNFERDMKKGK